MQSINRTNVSKWVAALALSVVPLAALGQGQIQAGRVNDANNRMGSGGWNGGHTDMNYNSNIVYRNVGMVGGPTFGNAIITGNVTQGREFRGNVGYTDPFAFRGPTAGIGIDNFAKNSAGVPRGGAPALAPNQSTLFYGASRTVATPPGFELGPNRNGYVPAAPIDPVRAAQDHRLGIVNLNQTIAPSDMIIPGGNNGIVTGSTLYGFREWNPRDAADRNFIEDLIARQSNGDRSNLDPRQVQKMREELMKTIQPDLRLKDQVNPADTTDSGKPRDSLTLDPIGRTFESPNDPLLTKKPISDQMQSQPLSDGSDAQVGSRQNMLGMAHRSSTQYAEMNKRLEQYYADRRQTDTEFARQFNSDVRAKQAAEAKAKAEAEKKIAANTVKPNTPNTTKPEKTTDDAEKEKKEKEKKKKLQPLKITTLSAGMKAEGVANVLVKAETLMKEGKYASALDQYDAADAVMPGNPMVLRGRAIAELGAGFFMRADAHLREAYTADKALFLGKPDLKVMLGEERLGKIVNELKETANKENKPTPLFLLAYIAYNSGHERQAMGYLDLADKKAEGKDSFYTMVREHWVVPEEGTKELNK